MVYHPGSQVIADTLSRLPVEAGEEGGSSQQEVLNIAAMEEEAQELSGVIQKGGQVVVPQVL